MPKKSKKQEIIKKNSIFQHIKRTPLFANISRKHTLISSKRFLKELVYRQEINSKYFNCAHFTIGCSKVWKALINGIHISDTHAYSKTPNYNYRIGKKGEEAYCVENSRNIKNCLNA